MSLRGGGGLRVQPSKDYRRITRLGLVALIVFLVGFASATIVFNIQKPSELGVGIFNHNSITLQNLNVDWPGNRVLVSLHSTFNGNYTGTLTVTLSNSTSTVETDSIPYWIIQGDKTIPVSATVSLVDKVDKVTVNY